VRVREGGRERRLQNMSMSVLAISFVYGTLCASLKEGFGLCEAETACCAGDEDDFVQEGEFREPDR
jgi:hypothetical protein